MRLALVAPHFPEYALRYAAGMARHGDVLACVDEGQLAAEYEGRAVPTGIGVIKRNRFRTPGDLIRLLRMIARFKPSVVHLQETAGPRRAFFNLCVAALAKRSSTIVLTVHDPLPHAGRDMAAAWRTAWVGDVVRRLADIVVVHGAYCAGLYRAGAHPTGQLIVSSEHGVILEPPTARPSLTNPLKLYFFGRMEVYKGVEVLLDAAEILHDKNVPFELSVAGRGPELDRLQDRFRRLPEVTVRNGFVPPTEVIESIQNADCVVLPYLGATQSGVLAAAFAGRRTVIASDTGGLPDVVEHGRNGLLVPPGDPAALAAAVQALAEAGELRDRLQAGAAATAKGQLNWDRIGTELHGVFASWRRERAERRAGGQA